MFMLCYVLVSVSPTNIPSTEVPGGCRQLDEAEVEPLTKCRSVLSNVAPWPDQNNICRKLFKAEKSNYTFLNKGN